MRKFAERVEKYLIRSVVLLLLVLVLVQGLMTREPWRIYLSWGERMEGQSIEFPVNTIKGDAQSPPQNTLGQEIDSPYAKLTLSLDRFSSLPKALILVNDREIKSFEDREVTLELMAGDVVEIDSTYYNFPVDYHITMCSENMAFPEKGKIYTANQSIVMIGKIVVK